MNGPAMVNESYCVVGRQYPKCVPGDPCKPILGSFVTECEVEGCSKIGGG